MEKPMVILALPKHDDDFTSTPYQLAKEFARSRNVLYVSHPYSWLDLLKNPTQSRIVKRFKAIFTMGNIELSEHPNLQILLLPLMLPINWLPPGKLYNWLSQVNHRIVARSINRVTKKLDLISYDFINSHDYYFADISGRLYGVSRYIYQCIDPIIKSYSAKHGTELERQAASSADLVIATSPFLRDRMLAYNPNSHLVPNAANFELCHRAFDSRTATVADIDKLEGIKFGYVGNIERRINYQLLVDVFEVKPEWQLIMVGPRDDQYIPQAFIDLQNLTLLPPVNHDQVPEVLKSIDISIIPFHCDEVSAQIYPLKMFEYLASGKPVISTNFNPEVLTELQDVVRIGNDVDEFIYQSNQALTADNPVLQVERIETARANDWSYRSEMILNLI